MFESELVHFYKDSVKFEKFPFFTLQCLYRKNLQNFKIVIFGKTSRLKKIKHSVVS